jgi:cytochrome oxidase Cu insertion factor (SCO1/SenC/PrrC family)
MIVPFLTLCPDVCPFTTGNAIQTARLLQSRHATNVRVVEITVDPRRDTVSRLQQYRKLVGLRERDRAITIWRTSPRNTEILKAYFGMTTEKMAVDAVHKDWMTNRPIAYEMDHSDGFYIVTDAQKLRFVSGLSARFVGKLTKAMTGFLNEEGLETLEHPSPGWTPRGALTALSYVAGSKF